MRSERKQKNAMMLTLLLFTVFLYGCGGSAGVKTGEIRLEMLDVTSKAPVEDVQVLLTAPDPGGGGGGQAVQLTRQLATDARGKVVFSDLPPDRVYTIAVAKDGFVQPADAGNDGPQFIPAFPGGNLTIEQGKTYNFTGYLRRSNRPTTGVVRGYVYERLSGRAITNATVYILGATAADATIIDTTDKASKPGYFELNDVPTGAKDLHIEAAGYAGQTHNIVVPGGGTLTWDVNLGTEVGTIRLQITAQGNDTFVSGYSLVTQVLRNGTEMVSQATVRPTAGQGGTAGQKSLSVIFGTSDGAGTADGTGPGVPVIPAGSTDTYTIKVVSDDARMVNPANGLTGIIVRQTGSTGSGSTGNNPVIDAGTIIMAINKGTINLVLYQVPYVGNLTGHSDANLRIQAPQVAITVENAFVTTRFVGENPTYFFNYTLEEVPVGSRKLKVSFPDHVLVSGADGTIDGVWVLKDQTTKILESINWAN